MLFANKQIPEKIIVVSVKNGAPAPLLKHYNYTNRYLK